MSEKNYIVVFLLNGMEILGIDGGIHQAADGLKRKVIQPLVVFRTPLDPMEAAAANENGVPPKQPMQVAEFSTFRDKRKDEIDYNVNLILAVMPANPGLYPIHERVMNPSQLALPEQNLIIARG